MHKDFFLTKFFNLNFNFLIILLCFILSRIFFFYIFDFKFSFESGDSYYYIDVARNIILNNTHINEAGHFYFRPPFYPFLLSIFFYFTDSYILFYITQSLFFFIFIIFLYTFLNNLNFKYTFLLCILISINPSDILYNGRILTETLLTILISTSAILFFYSEKYSSHIISGICIALAALTKDFYLYLIILFFFFGFL